MYDVYVIITKDNKYVAIDYDSGGYFIYVNETHRANFFDLDRAIRYVDVFKNNNRAKRDK